MRATFRSLISPLIAFALLLGVSAARAETQQQVLIDKSRFSIEKLLNNPDFTRMRAALKNAQGVLIIPSLLRGGIIIGGEGGTGVLMSRDANGEWSYPAFFSVGGGSIGLQIGFQDSEAVLVINTLKGLNAILNNNMKLGFDASVAFGEVGQGIAGSTTTALTADIEAYTKNRGLFAGGAFTGSVVSERADLNRDFYGAGATARAIVMDRAFRNPEADALRTAVVVQ